MSSNKYSTNVVEFVQALNNNEVVIFPTDTVWGIATNLDNVEKIYQIKNRPREKKVLFLVSSISAIEKYYQIALSHETKALLNAFWPGPISFILDIKGQKIGFRMPNHPVALDIIKQAGGILYVSSANISSQSPIESIKQLDGKMINNVSKIYSQDELILQMPSTIYDVTSKVILRPGPITLSQINNVMD